ncbi:phage antirepressor [Butyricicoccus porcorum]|uniref:phage antirepressor n=1 Tax=Butyricicoccus porcorum TaxID=1945634 RepID=UPI003F4AB565
MNKIKIFENPEFGSIRTLQKDGEPWFVGKDMAAALGYSNPRKAIADHVDEEDKGVTNCYTLGGNQNMTIINESGLYSLILSSKLPTAKKFKHWVTSEVLPSIRKTGGYISGQETMSDADLMAKALLVAQRQINQRDARIAEMQPKALFADSVAASKTSILIGELAKILKQNGVENMGQNRLFEWLRSNGYLIRRKGTDYNMPTQRAMELKLFEIKETVVSHADGHQTINKTPKVTGKGQQYFINAFLGGILRQPLHTD